MSLEDLMRNGRVLPGAFTRNPSNAVPIIGQKASEGAWKQVGIVRVDPPKPPTSDQPANPSWTITFGGIRACDDQMVVTAAAITQTDAELGIGKILEIVGMALNFLHTYQSCSCPTGIRCQMHTAPKEDVNTSTEPPPSVTIQ